MDPISLALVEIWVKSLGGKICFLLKLWAWFGGKICWGVDCDVNFGGLICHLQRSPKATVQVFWCQCFSIWIISVLPKFSKSSFLTNHSLQNLERWKARNDYFEDKPFQNHLILKIKFPTKLSKGEPGDSFDVSAPNRTSRHPQTRARAPSCLVDLEKKADFCDCDILNWKKQEIYTKTKRDTNMYETCSTFRNIEL